MTPMKIILPILLLFVVLAVLCAHVNLPGTDEAWFASPALNLITQGHFGTSVLDPTAAPHPGPRGALGPPAPPPPRRLPQEHPDRHRPTHLLDCALVSPGAGGM